MPQDDSPLQVIVYCGGNGAGKTSLATAVQEQSLTLLDGQIKPSGQFVNADQIAKGLTHIPAGNERDRAAQQEALRQRESLIAKRESFSFESVFSHPSRACELQSLKDANYSVYITFITTKDPQINVDRVKSRVETQTTTGHPVHPETVVTRYHRSLTLLPKAVEIADGSFVFDNSYDKEQPTLQVVVDNGQITLNEKLEPWVQTKLLDPLQIRQVEREAFEKELTKKNMPIEYADELKGQYSGTVISQSNHYFALRNDEGKISLHDKLMLTAMKEQSFTKGSRYEVTYEARGEPKAVELDRAPKISEVPKARNKDLER